MRKRKWIERAKRPLEGSIQEIVRILRVARKPEREEFTLMLKVCSLGLVVLGVYSFIILYLFFVLLVH
ncbi:MAG: protein translocase SEC61 complex subunit gamma [Candidatus Verstraetearchaeota archaeon]|nr:protein translocase SEC61 complex subunit gamma [Candidatus Verstraetearchaeota archaeon]